MGVQFILTDYVEQALSQAVYDKLEDGTFSGVSKPNFETKLASW